MASYHADGGQDLLGEGNEHTAEQAEEALAALAGVMALDAEAHLHHAPAKEDRLFTMVRGSSAARAGAVRTQTARASPVHAPMRRRPRARSNGCFGSLVISFLQFVRFGRADDLDAVQ